MKPIRKVRIATVKQTGRKYLVQQIDFQAKPEPIVRCWGEVESAKATSNGGGSSRHGESKAFVKSAVEITEVEKTWDLIDELWQQSQQAKRAKGYKIWTRKTYRGNRLSTNYGKVKVNIVSEALQVIEAALKGNEFVTAKEYTEKALQVAQTQQSFFSKDSTIERILSLAEAAEAKGRSEISDQLFNVATVIERA
jgi:hypothetical protein